MDVTSDVKPRHHRIKNKQLRTMVRSLITDLEHLQQEMDVVIKDVRDLMGQIDKISDKLDDKYGNDWTQDRTLSPRKPTVTKLVDQNLNHHYVNIDLMPKIQEIEDKIKRRIKNNPDQGATKQTISSSSSLEKGVHRPKSLTEHQTTKLEDETINNNRFDRILDTLESPMLDLSYIGIVPPNNRPCWSRSISLPLSETGSNSHPISEILPHIETPYREDLKTSPIAVCYAELKNRCVTLNNSNQSIDEVFYDIKTSTPTTVINSPDSSPLISNISIDGDLYERNLDDELEQIIETSEDSLHNESSDISMESGSIDQSETFSDNAEGRYDVNAWTSFTLSTSRGSSVSYVSDSTSDITNDNSMPPMANLFTSSMLVRKLSKHLDNDCVDLNQNVKE